MFELRWQKVLCGFSTSKFMHVDVVSNGEAKANGQHFVLHPTLHIVHEIRVIILGSGVTTS